MGTVSAVMHDTTDLDGTVSFWKELLGLEELFRNERYVYLSKLTESGPLLAFQQVPEVKPAKNRLHLDVRVRDREAAIARIVAWGGAHIRDVQEDDFPAWSVMTDPEGNEFCVYEPQQESD